MTDNEEKETAPFTVFFDQKEQMYLMYVQNSRLFRKEAGKVIEEEIVLVRYIGARSAVFTKEIWEQTNSIGLKRFVLADLKNPE